MNQQLLEAWEKAQAFIKTSIQQIENSVWFERALIRYESSDPRTQRRVIAGLRLSVAIAAFIAVAMPLWAVISAKGTLSGQRALLADIRGFNDEQAAVPEKPRPPSDWQNLPADSQEQVQSSLTQFLSSINLPEGSYVLDNGSELNLEVAELNLRQAVAVLFQVDGWFPRVQVSRMKLSVHPEKKDVTSLTLAMVHRGGAAGGAAGGDGADGSWEPDAGGEGMDEEFVDEAPTTPTTMPRGTSRPSNRDDGSEDEGLTDEPPIYDEPPASSGRGSVSPPPEGEDDDFDFDEDEGADAGDLPPPPFEGGDL